MINVSKYEKESEKSEQHGVYEDSIKEREVNLFWERRDRGTVLWCYVATTSNIIMQTMALMNPKSEVHITVSIIYMIGSILSAFVLFLKYKKICNGQYCSYWV